jgi:hypothetical protein
MTPAAAARGQIVNVQSGEVIGCSRVALRLSKGSLTQRLRYGRSCGDKEASIPIDLAWDNGRRLMLVWPPDEFEIIDSGETSTS